MAPGTRVTGNLPAELTSFVGRRGELAEVRRLLADSRLVTLTGIGGVGKTRLALRAAAGLRRAFRDGAWLVQLDQLRDEGLVAQAVAGALGLQDRAGYAPPAAFLHSICTQLDSTVWARLRVLGRGTDAGSQVQGPGRPGDSPPKRSQNTRAALTSAISLSGPLRRMHADIDL
jgi:hypothetical protein